tara:strand:- start:545 stop:757 length:213 start_codon:yes stop_codon:yes gene_type:complete
MANNSTCVNWNDAAYFAKNVRAVFEKAIEDGAISRRAAIDGSIMYMYSTPDWHWFKQRDTRDYVKVSALS